MSASRRWTAAHSPPLSAPAQALGAGALPPPLWGFEEREKLMVFYERASGSRMHAAYFRVGGVHQDLPPKLIDDIEAWCDPFLQVVADLETLLTGNRIFKQRNVDIGVVSLKEAWERGFSGVLVRGSGAAVDPRKHPRGREAPARAHQEAVYAEAARAGRPGPGCRR